MFLGFFHLTMASLFMRYFALSLALILGLQLLLSKHSQAQEIAIQLPDTTALGLSTMTVPLSVNDITGLDIISLEFTLVFDSTIIQVENIVKDNYLAEVFPLLEFNATQPGRVIVAGASGGTPLSGEGTLLGLQLTFLKEGVSDLVFENFQFDPGNPSISITHGRVRNIAAANRDQHESISSSFTLHNNYPNPFINRTHVVMDLHAPAIVGIEVYNSQGQRVLEVPFRHMQAGSNQQVDLNLPSIPAGTYLYRVTALGPTGHHTATKFITVIR